MIINLLLILIGMVIGYCVSHKRTVIEIRTTMIDWLVFEIVAYFIICFAFFAEVYISKSILPMLTWTMGKNLVQGGLITAIMGFLMSVVLGKNITCFELDLHELYGDIIIKIIISVIIVINCFLWWSFFKGYSDEYDYFNLFSDRLVAWIVMAIGIWTPIGAGCKGRINKYRDNERKTQKLYGLKDVIMYYFSIFIGLPIVGALVYGCLFETETTGKAINLFLHGGRVIALGIMLMFLAFIFIEIPGEKRSQYILNKCFNEKCDNHKTHHYRNICYRMVVEQRYVMLEVCPKLVIDSFNQDKADVIFSYKQKIFAKDEEIYSRIREYLLDEKKKRDDYMAEAFQGCRERMISNGTKR